MVSHAGGEFSVYQFFPNEAYEEVATRVGAEEAMRQVVALTQSVGARVGTTTRVIITDGGDFTCFEWVFGLGVVFPIPKPPDIPPVAVMPAVDPFPPDYDAEGGEAWAKRPT